MMLELRLWLEDDVVERRSAKNLLFLERIAEWQWYHSGFPSEFLSHIVTSVTDRSPSFVVGSVESSMDQCCGEVHDFSGSENSVFCLDNNKKEKNNQFLR